MERCGTSKSNNRGGRAHRLPQQAFALFSLTIPSCAIAWAYLNTNLVLFWGGTALSHEQSAVVAMALIACWHAAVFAAGRWQLFKSPVVFCMGVFLPVIAYTLSANGFFQPTAWTAWLALATTTVVTCSGIAYSMALNRPEATKLLKTFLTWLSYGIASGYLVLCAATAFASDDALIEGSADNLLDSQQAFDAVVESPPSSASQQEMANAFASLAEAEASRLGIEETPRVAIGFEPLDPYAAKTVEDGTIIVNARFLSYDTSENAFNVIHEVFHKYQQQVVDGTIAPTVAGDGIARQLAEQHSESWAQELASYSSIYEGQASYEAQWVEKDADVYANIAVAVFEGKASYADV